MQGDKYDSQEISQTETTKETKKVSTFSSSENVATESQATSANLDQSNESQVNDDAPSDRQMERIERIERFQKKYLNENPESKEIVETAKEIAGEEYESMDIQLKLGIIFLVIAAAIFLFYVFSYVKASTVDDDTSTADGCIDSLFEMAFYGVLTIIFGVGTIVFLALGIVFIVLGIVSMQKKKAAK